MIKDLAARVREGFALAGDLNGGHADSARMLRQWKRDPAAASKQLKDWGACLRIVHQPDAFRRSDGTYTFCEREPQGGRQAE
jgi:hypothetical protein